MPIHVRRADQPRSRRAKLLFGAFRVVLYGFLGLASEVLFYTLVRLGREVPVVRWLFKFDWQVDARLPLGDFWHAPLVALYGRASLWMFVVYAVASFGIVETVYRRGARWPWYARAVVYGLGILVFEGLSGVALQHLTGYAIWYYADRLAVIGSMTSFAILPLWCAAGLFVEAIYRELMDPELARAIEAELARGGDPGGGATPR